MNPAAVFSMCVLKLSTAAGSAVIPRELRMLASLAAIGAKLQQVPQGFWLFTGVTTQ